MKRALLIALVIVPTACAGILGLRKANTKRFEHRAHVLKGIACVDCHKDMDKAGDQGALHLPSDADCVTCHEEPHDTRPCSGCHAGEFTRHDLTQAREYLRFSHAKHLPEVKGNCVRCHQGVESAESNLRPTMASCLSCHQHRDQFATRDCKGCHVNLSRELTRPESHLIHGTDFMDEHGTRAASAGELCASCHTERFCASCHGATTPALPSRIAFDQPMSAGMHRAGFMSRHAEASQADPGLCSTCHTESSCQGCHDKRAISARPDERRASPHPPGWVSIVGRNEHGRAARLDPAACASCHSGAGEALCVSCHAVGGVGGNPHPVGWTSERSLEQRPCRACHISGAL